MSKTPWWIVVFGLSLVFWLAALVVGVAISHGATDEERLERYTPTAQAAWVQGPCLGRIRVVLHGVPDNGWAGEATPATCSIVFRDDETRSDEDFCRELVHEYGHLAGFGHSDDPADIMNHWSRYSTFAPCVDGSPPLARESAYVRDWITYQNGPARKCHHGRRMWGRCR